VWQGLLKVLAGVDTNFTLTQKDGGEDGDFSELYQFRVSPTNSWSNPKLGLLAVHLYMSPI
jgi:hypothetical protein